MRQLTVFDVELDQGLDVLGDEGDGGHHHADAVASRLDDHVGRGGAQPFQRPHPALVAEHPVGQLGASGDGGDGGLHLLLIGIALSGHQLFGNAVGGEEHPQRLAWMSRFRLGELGADRLGLGLDPAVQPGIAADGPHLA